MRGSARGGGAPLPAAIRAFAAAAALLVLSAPGTGQELPEDRWKAAEDGAAELMRVAGKVDEKVEVIEELGFDDSERAAKLLVKWALASERWQLTDLLEEHHKRKNEFDKLERLLRKAYDKLPPTNAEHLASWQTARKAHVAAQSAYTAEFQVQTALAEALARVTDDAAVKYLQRDAIKSVKAAKYSATARLAIVKCLVRQPIGRVQRTLLTWAKDPEQPAVRILVIEWIGEERLIDSIDFVVGALKDPLVAVRRAAVAALAQLDDPDTVKPLIDCLQTADGLLADEIDEALHGFTGQTFDGAPDIWLRWWHEEGEKWLAGAAKERLAREERKSAGGGASFYGIQTKSQRIVFVLDRSGSMQHAVKDAGAKPKGPVTGQGKGEGDEAVAGDTKIEIAKNQLARSIQGLIPGTAFNVVFYGTDVKVWKPPPSLVGATPANKKAAEKWFRSLPAEGSTQLFDALMQALEYAPVARGKAKAAKESADTIFLLSDGAPTGADGQPLPRDALDKAYEAFLDANRVSRCVVHTIGIGPGHNAWFMRQLAEDTGGQYLAVGVR